MAKKFAFFKKQIQELKDIKDTVKALEKISSANIHNLKITSQNMRNYERALQKIFSDILPEKTIFHPLFRNSQTSRRLIVILSAEEGLCGGLLNRLFDFVRFHFKENDKVLVIGEKGKKLCQERKIKVDHFFPATKDIPKEKDIKEIKDFIISQFLNKTFDQVLIFYLKFENLAIQRPNIFNLLPLNKKKFEAELGEELKPVLGFPIYEPNQKGIIDYLIKDYLGLVFYQKILETKLSELSARTITMEDAAEKAQKLINRFSHQYFREKREIITKDINDLYSHRL